MRIGFSSFVLQGGKTGVATYIVNLLKHLKEIDQQNEYEVMVPDCDRHLLPPQGKNFSHLVVASFLGKPIRSILWHNAILPLLTQRMHFDILHVPTYRRIPRVKKCKLVATVHDLAALTLEKKYDAARTFYNVRVVPHLLHNCDHLIAVSESTKRDIVRHVGFPEDRVSVIYPGIDCDTYKPMDQSKARDRLVQRYGLKNPFLVYVSRIEHPGKNHVNLIRAFEDYKTRVNSPHKLVLAGAYWPGAEEVFKFARRSKCKDDIMFLGFVPTADLVALYSCCDLMVHPSLFEGFGFPIIEAAACGAQVICADTSSLEELGRGRFPLFDPCKPLELSQLIEVSLDREFTESDRQKGMEYAAGFNWHDTASEVLKVYEHL